MIIYYYDKDSFERRMYASISSSTRMNRPPEVRPKNLTIGGRFSYGKI